MRNMMAQLKPKKKITLHSSLKSLSLFGSFFTHTGEKTTYLSRNYQEFDVETCEFCEKIDSENVNFVKNETLKM